MQYGPKPIMSARQPRPAASFAAGSKRWTSSAARPGSQNPQRSYERYLALARAEAQVGNSVGAENYYQYGNLHRILLHGLHASRPATSHVSCR
jgi:hypothetical protein